MNEFDVFISINFIEGKKGIEFEHFLRNPKIHYETNYGFVLDYGRYVINWNVISKPLKIDIMIYKNPGYVEFLQRIRSIQYTSLTESIGQILHENVLVPLSFFFDDIAPIHCSAIANINGKVLMLGGTGGSGKSSMLVSIRKEPKFYFVSDDIAIMSKNKTIEINYAFPKIYAYNVEGDKILEREILKGRGLIDKTHWYFRKWINSAKVRRRVNPSIFWNLTEKDKLTLKSYIILLRGNYEKPALKTIDYKLAAEASIKIILSEYWNFELRILWHEFNRILHGSKPIIDLKSTIEKWINIYEANFKESETYIAEIPLTIEHNSYKRWINDIMNSILS